MNTFTELKARKRPLNSDENFEERIEMTGINGWKFFCIALLALYAASAGAQVPNPPVLDGANSPPNDALASEIPGFKAVTQAMDPTGNGTRYDVNPSDELTVVPWQSLQPGDVVNIFHRAEPYRHKIMLSEQGTAENPIVVNGVTDASGNRPVIHGDNAVTINPDAWNDAYRTAILVLNKHHRQGTYGVNAEHYIIRNLHLVGARPSHQFTHDGVTENYPTGARAIWSAGGQNITLEGMIFEDTGGGVFIQAADDPGALSKHWVIRGSKFLNNGFGSFHHQLYFQAVSDPGVYNIVEGNYFGPSTASCSCTQIKMRSTGAIIRYNHLTGSPRIIDIVEAQDAIPGWIYANYTPQEILNYYRSSHVYGNVIDNDDAAGRPLHFGADTFDDDATWGAGPAPNESGMRGDGSPTYFYHNTDSSLSYGLARHSFRCREQQQQRTDTVSWNS